MSSKEFNAEKKLKKNKSNLKNGGQQIFVLPPNLLQKLGINLGNMGGNPISPDMARKKSTCAPSLKHGHSSSITQHEINSNIVDNETSIVKTASLMKESVFLSPTFNTVTNSHNARHVEDFSVDVNHAVENSKTEKLDTSNVVLEPNFINKNKLDYEHNNRVYDVGLSHENKTVEINGSTPSEKCILQNDSKKVINIISEETVTIEKLNELKVLQMPTKNAMIPTSLDTLIVKSININSVPQNQKLDAVAKGIIDIKQHSGSEDTEDYGNTDNNENHILNFKGNEQISENRDITDKAKQAINYEHTEFDKYLDDHNNQVNINLEDQILENKTDYSPHHNNVNITDNINELISTEPDFIDDALMMKSSTPIKQSYSKLAIDNNNSLLNNHTNVVENDCDITLEAMINIYSEPNKEPYLPVNTNTKYNNWDQYNSKVEQSEMEKTTACIHNNKQQTNLIDSEGEEDTLDGNKSIVVVTSIQQNNMINSHSVSAQSVSQETNDDYTTSLIEDVKSSTNQYFTGTVDDKGISELSMPLNPNRNNLMSKLCIHGVEKPGGIEIDEMKSVSLKTYSNNKRNKLPKSFLSSDENIFGKNIDHNCDIDLTGINTVNNPPSDLVCKCSDYGILDYDQIENSYEHIHYSCRRHVDCSPDVIFDIYKDSEIKTTMEVKENLDYVENNIIQTDSENSEHSICWYIGDSIQNTNNTDFEDIQNQENMSHTCSQAKEINENHYIMIIHDDDSNECTIEYQFQTSPIIQHDLELTFGVNTSPDVMSMEAKKEADKEKYVNTSNTSNKLDSTKKRKLSDNSSEVSDNKKVKNNRTHDHKVSEEKNSFKGWKDADESQNNLNKQEQVKCAVCGVSVMKTEWTEHLATSHDYIAWQEGEPPVDIDDEDAIRNHLHHIVQEEGHLKCSRCGLTRKYAKPFLHHVKICKSPSDVNVEKPSTSVLNKSFDSFRSEHSGLHGRSIRESGILTRFSRDTNDENESTIVMCGVCKEELALQDWIPHIQNEHSYKAWREGETPLNVEDEASVRKHLYRILQQHGPLVCNKCGKSRRYVKLFLQHIEECTGSKEQDETAENPTFVELESLLDMTLNHTETVVTILIKCAMCHLEIDSKQWINHIQKEHNYLSWQEGRTPLNVCDKEAIRKFLYIVVQRLGALVCGKCGVARKYVKSYLSHIENCSGPPELNASNTDNTSSIAKRSLYSENDSVNDSVNLDDSDRFVILDDDTEVKKISTVKCGVCQKDVPYSNWIAHIGMSHEYIAWKDTEPPVDVNNREEVWEHLTNIIKRMGTLKCADCGKKCKCAKAYLLHVKTCYGKIYVPLDDDGNTLNDCVSDAEETSTDEADSKNIVKCAVCTEEMQAQRWIDHIQKQHNYLAWQEGDKPLSSDDKELIRNHFKSIQLKIGKLLCTKCGFRPKQLVPFYNHVKYCEGYADASDSSELQQETSETGNLVKCAVCYVEVPDTAWIDHIAKKHEYMAWKEGQKPLNMNDETSVKDHLYKISQRAGELICKKCGQSRKYVKSYLQHTRGCTGSEESTVHVKAPKPKAESSKSVTCALCRKNMDDNAWMEHIGREHNYISWKQNNPPLVFEDEKSLRDHLYNIVQSIGSLVCSKCGLVRKYAKAYLMHIETCQQVTWMSINKMIRKMKKQKGDIVHCAVCSAELDDTEWIDHIANEHNYLAWRDRDPPINLDDDIEVRNHLRTIIQEEGYLKCPKCKGHRKYAKLYLQHVNTCDGIAVENSEINETMMETRLKSGDTEDVDTDGSTVVKCGVCALELAKSSWYEHIQKEHKYLAWQEGMNPLDLNDKEAVYNHLTAVNVKCKGLTCNSCGLVRKYVKAYLHHVRGCNERNYIDSNEIVECGVCGEKMEGKMWRDHAMNTHYNVAWVVGGSPIDVRNFFSVDKYLKEYHEYKHRLVCNICGLSRASLAGFYAHVLVCGKTDQEADSWKDVCDICNQKYLCIYKTQHYWMHRVQEVAKERKMNEKLKIKDRASEDINCTPGRRRAAEKARSVIEDYAAKFSNKCKDCNFESDSKEELASHRCSKRAMNANEDSDDSVSIKLDDSDDSDEESDGTDIDSNLSNEEDESMSMEPKKKIKNEVANKLTTKTAKFPFVVRDVKPYLHESKIDHLALFYSRETLFKHWKSCSYEVVSDELRPQYMPQLEQSCKVTISNGGWDTYKRFESKKQKGCTVLFTGACIQCISWAPEHPDSTPDCPSLLAVATHRGPDCPRLECTETPSHPALIQIWDFYNFKCLPKLAFGLAHDYGTVWAMDWCPSGARDFTAAVNLDDTDRPRLGLLAIACSNGSAYVISVPYPDKNQTSNIPFYKIKPCVELRVTRGCKKYQATSINWSLFKGYTTISVGYGDGTLALYDLVTESPLLMAKEDDMFILYPFQDERVHNSCVTGVTSCVLGAWCSSSVTGSTAAVGRTEPRAGRGARPVRTHSSLAASAATFMPHWPNVMLSGDDTIVGLSPSELEWGYVGRRVGSVRALAPCNRRARVCAVVPPLLQVMRPHPAAFKGHKTIHKKNIAMLEMTPLAKKRSKHTNDEFSMKVEPITYEEAIASYGIEFKFEKDFDKAFLQRVQQKHRVPYPERFPLADVPALAYCPASSYYTKLALAAHCGLIFLLDV